MRVVSVVVCLVLAGCASVDEVRGDSLLASGDEDGALGAYRDAMQKRPIIDWEYEHLRDKRLRILEGKWSPIATDAIARSERRSGVEAVKGLLATRKDMRAGAATVPVMTRIDNAVAFKLRVEDWPTPTSAQVEERVNALLELLELLRAQGGTQRQLDALAARLDEALKVPLPPATDWRQRLTLLLQWREAMRRAGVPQATDARLAFEFEKFATARVEPMAVATAGNQLERSVTLRLDARRLGAGTPAVSFADAMLRENVARFLEAVKPDAERGDYFGAVLRLAPWSSRVDPGPLQAAMAEYAKAGSAQALERAKAAGNSGRAFLYASMSQALGGDASLRSAVRKELGVERSLAFTPAVNGSCAVAPVVAGSFGSGPAGRLTLDVRRCSADLQHDSQQRSESYTQLRTVMEQQQVQVGTRYEQVQTGSHQVQCNQSSSLPGYTWQGLCTVPDYETKAFPVFETRDVPVEKEVQDSVAYTVGVHTWVAHVSAEARFTTDEGTVLTANFDQDASRVAQTFSYEVPGRAKNDPVKTRRQELDKSFTGEEQLRSAASMLGSKLVEDLRAQWKQHRVRVALEAGRAAVKAGNKDEAIDAFVRAALIDGKVDDEVGRQLFALTGVASSESAKLLSSEGGSVVGGAPEGKFADATPYESTGMQVVSDGWEKTAAANNRDVSVSTETYQAGIYPPNEFVDFHVGIVPGEIQLTDVGANPGLMVALEGHYSPLEWLGLRYFFAVHDEIGLRLAMGIKLFKSREYDSGSETGFAFALDGHYTLVAGLRLPWFSVMAGARVGLMHMAVGELNAGGFHFEPAARVALRFFEQNQVILEASGFFGIPGVPYKNRFALSFPLLGKAGLDVLLSVEQTNFTASDLGPDGKTRVQLGKLPVHQVGLQVGARL
ncbi:MAG: hypothetical protein U0228_22990 [Myxococcaceae bacterium]